MVGVPLAECDAEATQTTLYRSGKLWDKRQRAKEAKAVDNTMGESDVRGFRLSLSYKADVEDEVIKKCNELMFESQCSVGTSCHIDHGLTHTKQSLR